MDAQQLVNEFLASEHGSQATAALAVAGVSADDAQQLLAHAAQAANDHVEAHHVGLVGEHTGRNFFATLGAGLVRGHGFFMSLEEGGEGLLVGRIHRGADRTRRAGFVNGFDDRSRSRSHAIPDRISERAPGLSPRQFITVSSRKLRDGWRDGESAPIAARQRAWRP